MQTELEIMKKRKVWKLVKLPENAKALGCRWVYTVKTSETGDIPHFKARLVAQGHLQRKGISYDETFSPVCNFAVIRYFFSVLVSLYGWSHIQLDVASAYLYAPLEETIYMKQPPGFNNTNEVCLLQKAIYGLHQSSREWYFEIHETLIQLGFVKLEWVNCCYVLGRKILLLIYVDDIIVFGRKPKHTQKAVNLITQKFECKILGKTTKLLGVNFENENGHLFIHQRDYISKICHEYDEFKYPISSLPIPVGKIYSKEQSPKHEREIKQMLKIPYRNLIGSLAFIANRTRPDICYALNIFSQFQENPGLAHWEGLLKVLGYLKYTVNFKLNLSQVNNLNLNAFSDADFANNRDDRVSMGGLIVFADKAPIVWRSFKQKSVCLSNMESEFVALTETSKELIWFQRIVLECQKLGIFKDVETSPLLLADNQASIEFVKNPIQNHRTKHIDIRLFFIRDFIYKKFFKIQYIQSKLNLADIFTKPQVKSNLKKFNEQIFEGV